MFLKTHILTPSSEMSPSDNHIHCLIRVTQLNPDQLLDASSVPPRGFSRAFCVPFEDTFLDLHFLISAKFAWDTSAIIPSNWSFVVVDEDPLRSPMSELEILLQIDLGVTDEDEWEASAATMRSVFESAKYSGKSLLYKSDYGRSNIPHLAAISVDGRSYQDVEQRIPGGRQLNYIEDKEILDEETDKTMLTDGLGDQDEDFVDVGRDDEEGAGGKKSLLGGDYGFLDVEVDYSLEF